MVPLVNEAVDKAADLPFQVPRQRVVLQLEQVLPWTSAGTVVIER